MAADGGSGSSRGSAVVADALLTATGLNIVTDSKSYSGVVANFTDANVYASNVNFTATIQWREALRPPVRLGRRPEADSASMVPIPTGRPVFTPSPW